MEDVEELGKLVYKLSQEQVESLREEIAAKQAEQEGEAMDTDENHSDDEE